MLDILEDNELEKEIKKENSFFYFSYPGGHYSQKAIDIIRQEGYKAAFSIKPGLIKKGDNLLLIKRNVIIKDMSFWQFKLRSTKAIDWYVKIVRFFKRYAK